MEIHFAPPLTLTLSRSIPASRITASAYAANASFSSISVATLTTPRSTPR
jgi:hypothetical protein